MASTFGSGGPSAADLERALLEANERLLREGGDVLAALKSLRSQIDQMIKLLESGKYASTKNRRSHPLAKGLQGNQAEELAKAWEEKLSRALRGDISALEP